MALTLCGFPYTSGTKTIKEKRRKHVCTLSSEKLHNFQQCTLNTLSLKGHVALGWVTWALKSVCYELN